MSRTALRIVRQACACSLLLALGAVMAADDRHGPVTQQLGADRFTAGGEVVVGRAVEGDLVVAGGNIEVDAAVAGDALVFGGQVRLRDAVGGSVVGAAGQMTIDGRVGHNVRVAGGRVELGPSAEVAGNVSIGGGQLRVRGAVRGQVLAGGGRVLIDAPVGGDVVIGGGSLALGPNARIAGRLRYRSGSELQQDPAAQVAGGIERLAPLAGREPEMHARGWRWGGAGKAVAGLVWTLGLMVLAGVLLGLRPDACAEVARSLRERPGASLLLGFALLVCMPVAAVLLFVTLVGVPLGLVVLALYAALLPLAYVSAAIGIGAWALHRGQPQRADRLAIRFVAAALVLLALSLLHWIPALGAVVGLLVLLSGLGALALQVRRPPAPARSETAAGS